MILCTEFVIESRSSCDETWYKTLWMTNGQMNSHKRFIRTVCSAAFTPSRQPEVWMTCGWSAFQRRRELVKFAVTFVQNTSRGLHSLNEPTCWRLQSDAFISGPGTDGGLWGRQQLPGDSTSQAEEKGLLLGVCGEASLIRGQNKTSLRWKGTRRHLHHTHTNTKAMNVHTEFSFIWMCWNENIETYIHTLFMPSVQFCSFVQNHEDWHRTSHLTLN